jgi:transposase
MPASWMTILRRVMARPSASVKQFVQLGLDDCSFRRGRTFGTILVERPRHQVIDLLPDRKVETVSAWMRAHPEIRLVSRDRAGAYASAAARAAPQARQCADRFHLLQNLGETLEGVLARHLAAHRNHQTEQFSATPLQGAPSRLPAFLSSKGSAAEASPARGTSGTIPASRGFTQAKRCSCFFTAQKHWRLKTKKPLLCFGLCTPKSIRHMNWSSSLPTCCGLVLESSLITGSNA